MPPLPSDPLVLVRYLQKAARRAGNAQVVEVLEEASAEYEFQTDGFDQEFALMNVTLDADSFLSVDDSSDSIEDLLSSWARRATTTYKPEVRGVRLGLRFDDGGPVPLSVSAKDEVRLWKPGYFRLFLSHSSLQKVAVADLKKALSQLQVDAFVAHEDIEPTKRWEQEIRLALASCHAITFLSTREAQESVWCNQEVGWGLGRGLLVQSVKFDCEPRGFAGADQALASKWTDLPALARSLVEIFSKHERSQAAMHEPMVSLLETAGSWARARFAATLIDGFDGLDRDQVHRLLSAVTKNTEVSEAWEVPEILERVARRHGVTPGQQIPLKAGLKLSASDDEYDPFADS